MITDAFGASDEPTGARLGLHVYVAEKGDYYVIIVDSIPRTIPETFMD